MFTDTVSDREGSSGYEGKEEAETRTGWHDCTFGKQGAGDQHRDQHRARRDVPFHSGCRHAASSVHSEKCLLSWISHAAPLMTSLFFGSFKLTGNNTLQKNDLIVKTLASASITSKVCQSEKNTCKLCGCFGVFFVFFLSNRSCEGKQGHRFWHLPEPFSIRPVPTRSGLTSVHRPVLHLFHQQGVTSFCRVDFPQCSSSLSIGTRGGREDAPVFGFWNTPPFLPTSNQADGTVRTRPN